MFNPWLDICVSACRRMNDKCAGTEKSATREERGRAVSARGSDVLDGGRGLHNPTASEKTEESGE